MLNQPARQQGIGPEAGRIKPELPMFRQQPRQGLDYARRRAAKGCKTRPPPAALVYCRPSAGLEGAVQGQYRGRTQAHGAGHCSGGFARLAQKYRLVLCVRAWQGWGI